MVVFADAVGDDLASSNIFNAGQIPNGSLIDQAAHITAPDLMGLGDGMQCFHQVLIGVMGGGTCAIARDASSGWAQLEMRHHSLSTFMVDAQMQGDAAMSISRVVTMDGFDLVLEQQIFDWLTTLTIDVLSVDAQRFGADRFMWTAPNYFDFF